MFDLNKTADIYFSQLFYFSTIEKWYYKHCNQNTFFKQSETLRDTMGKADGRTSKM